MTDRELQYLAGAIEDLKKSTRRNDPMLRGLMASPGWISLSLFAAVGLTLYCLPAQILLAAYGGYRWIPPEFKILLWSIIAVVLVGGGVWKTILLINKVGGFQKGKGLQAVLKASFGGLSFHIAVPLLIAIGSLIAFVCVIGYPWYTISFTAILVCFWANFVGTMIGRKDFLGIGWWCLVTGCASLFFVNSAPLIWLFVIYGGMCYIFAGTLIAANLKEKQKQQ